MFKNVLIFVLIVCTISLSACGAEGSMAPLPTSTPFKLEFFIRGDLGMMMTETRSIEIKRGETIQSGITLKSFFAKRYAIYFNCYGGGQVINFLEQSGGLFEGMEMKPRIKVRQNAKSCQGDLFVIFWLNDQIKETLRTPAAVNIIE